MIRSYSFSPPKRLRGVWWDSFSFSSITTKPCISAYKEDDGHRNELLNIALLGQCSTQPRLKV
jgi:hypothetical protein